MLHAFARKLLAEVTKGAVVANTEGPVGTLTHSEGYDQLRFGDIDGIGTVQIDRTGNMVGFSPVERCQDKSGEIAWIPTERVRNMRLTYFAFAEKAPRAGRETK
jgi:hypothetical protein